MKVSVTVRVSLRGLFRHLKVLLGKNCFFLNRVKSSTAINCFITFWRNMTDLIFKKKTIDRLSFQPCLKPTFLYRYQSQSLYMKCQLFLDNMQRNTAKKLNFNLLNFSQSSQRCLHRQMPVEFSHCAKKNVAKTLLFLHCTFETCFSHVAHDSQKNKIAPLQFIPDDWTELITTIDQARRHAEVAQLDQGTSAIQLITVY